MTKQRKLTAKQESYKNNRIKGMGKTEALLASTYSTDNMSKGAIYAEAQKLDAHPLISLEIEKGKEAARSESIMTRDEALQTLTTHARVKVTDVFNFRFEPVIVKGKEEMRTVWEIKPSEDIAPEVAACIKSISFDTNGRPRIETYDSDGAIKQLRAMEGWDAPKKTALTDEHGKFVPLSVNVDAPEVAAALVNLMDKL